MSVPPDPVALEKPIEATALPYKGLRLTVRLTGVLVMIAGLVYLFIVLGSLCRGLLPYNHPGEFAYALVVTLLALGIGYFIFRVGWAMLISVNPGTTSIFSFLFSLVYTPILFHLLPSSELFSRHPGWLLLLMFFYFGLSYFMLNRILLFLLFPDRKDS